MAATVTEGPTPTAEEKTRIMAAKKELVQALMKKRALDKQLVRSAMLEHTFVGAFIVCYFIVSNRVSDALSGGPVSHGNVITQRREHHPRIRRIFEKPGDEETLRIK